MTKSLYEFGFLSCTYIQTFKRKIAGWKCFENSFKNFNEKCKSIRDFLIMIKYIENKWKYTYACSIEMRCWEHFLLVITFSRLTYKINIYF